MSAEDYLRLAVLLRERAAKISYRPEFAAELTLAADALDRLAAGIERCEKEATSGSDDRWSQAYRDGRNAERSAILALLAPATPKAGA